MKEYTFSLSNGFACGNNFTATLQDAINICLKNSCYMNTRNWLHIHINGKWVEIGHSVKIDFREWDFWMNENINL